MDWKGVAIAIAALGTIGIPALLIILTVGGLFAGFALWSILGFLSQWMVPLIFFGSGVVALLVLAPKGPRSAIIGVLTLGVFVILGVFIWSGAFSGPVNTYSVLLSFAPLPGGGGGSISPSPVGSIVLFGAFVLGITGTMIGILKIHKG